MIKRKKRGKTLLSEADSLLSEDSSYSMNPQRNILTALDERISELERGRRNSRKSTCFARQNDCKSQRPHSVPTRIMCFNPYTMHEEENEGSDEKQNQSLKKNCRWCTLRSRRSSMPRGETTANTQSESTKKDDFYLSSNRLYDSADSYENVYSSPRPAKYYRDYSDSAADCKRAWSSGRTESQSFHPEERGISSVVPNWKFRYGQMYPSVFARRTTDGHEMMPSYLTRSKSDDFLRVQSQPWANNAGRKKDSKIEFLLAKYSDYNYPKMMSPCTSYLPYKSSFMRSVENESSNRSSHIRSVSFNNDTTTIRAPRNSFTYSSLPSRCVAMINNYLKKPTPQKYTNTSLNCAYDYITSQPHSSSTFLSDTKFRIPMRTTRNTTSDLPRRCKCEKYTKPWLEKKSSILRSELPVTFLRGSASVSSLGSQMNVSDNRKFKNRFRAYNVLDSSDTRADGSKYNLEYCNPFRNIESPLLSCPKQFDYKDSMSLKTYTPHATKTTPKNENSDNSNYNRNRTCSPKWDVMLSKRYDTSEWKPSPMLNNLKRYKNNNPMPSYDSLLNPSGSVYGARSSNRKILEFDNSYLNNADSLNITRMFDKYDHRLNCKTSDSEPASKIWEIDEPDKSFKSNFTSNFLKEKPCSRSYINSAALDSLSIYSNLMKKDYQYPNDLKT